jgi:hypothetical protein
MIDLWDNFVAGGGLNKRVPTGDEMEKLNETDE